MNVLEKIRQYLVKVFVKRNKRFPTPVEFNEQLDLEARKVFDGAFKYNLEQAKGKNLDEAQVMEQTMNKNSDQLVDDYLSYEAMNIKPTFTQVDERKLPRAEIEALPLKDKEKAEAAVRKKLEAQNVQAKQSKEGGETPGGPQRGRPQAVDENFRDTIYIDKSEMQKLTDQAWKYFDAAESAMAQGKFDEARAILRYEIADNYQFPANIREAAEDARNMIDRNGLAWKDMGYESYDEGLEAFNEKIAKGQQQTMEDNWVDFTDPLEPEKQKPQRIEYVSFFDEPGEDFGTPNDSISDISKLFYNYAKGGRVGFSEGGIKGKLIEIINKISKSRKVKKPEAENFAQLLDDIEQAKKAGIIDEAGFKSFQRGIESMRDAAYGSRMKYQGAVPGSKSALPVDDKDLVPKTNLQKIRSQKKADDEGIKSLARSGQIPVRNDTSYIVDRRKKAEDLLKTLYTKEMKDIQKNNLKALEVAEKFNLSEAEYDKLRMLWARGTPSKAMYRRDPDAAEALQRKNQKAGMIKPNEFQTIEDVYDKIGYPESYSIEQRTRPGVVDDFFGKNKTKIISRTLNEDQVRLLGIKENIPEEQVEKFIQSEDGILKRGQGRGVVTKDEKGNYYIKDKYSKKYVGAPITADEETAKKMAEFMKQNDPEGYNEIQKIVDEINQRIDLEDFKTKGRKPNAEGGLNYLLGF